ncbi:MAG: redoxin domain-containing protein [Planctomycetia bacterium]|nr:redoxin domain-containing protein [Planctomycetia bacterium]
MQKALLSLAAVVFLVLIGFMGYLIFKGDGEKPVAQKNDVPPKVVKTNPAPEDAPPIADPSVPVGTSIGQMAPQISGEDVDGVAFKLSDYRGKVVVLDFWGFW